MKRITKEKCFHGPVLFEIEAATRHDRLRLVIDLLRDRVDIATVETRPRSDIEELAVSGVQLVQRVTIRVLDNLWKALKNQGIEKRVKKGLNI